MSIKIKNIRSIIISLLIFIVLILAVAYLFYLIQENNYKRSKLEVNNQASNIASVFRNRINRDIYLLYGMRGFYAGSNSVERNEFKTFGDGFDIADNFPGIHSVVFIQKVPISDKDIFTENVKQDTSINPEGYPNFNIHPESNAENLFLEKYIYPEQGNISDFGLDFASDPVKKIAMDKALETDKVAITDKIFFENEKTPTYMIFIPIYKNGTSHDSIEDRMNNLEGFLAVIIKTDKFFNSIMQSEKIDWSNFDLYIYDKFTNPGPENENSLIFDADNESAEENKEAYDLFSDVPLDFADKKWKLHFVADENYGIDNLELLMEWIILAAGVILNIIISFFIYYLLSSRKRALDITEEITKKLSESEEKYKSIVSNIDVGIYRNTIDKGGKFLEVNPAMVNIFGYNSREELLGKKVADLYPSPNDRLPIIDEFKKKGFVDDKEIKLVKKDGSIIWVTLTAKVTHDKKGNIVWVDGIMKDITAQKEISQKEKEKSEELEKINKLMIGRELKMIELKKEIEKLKNK